MGMMPEPLFIVASWDRPEYHGLRENGTVDWPPSPVRLLGALTSGAYKLPKESRGQVLEGLQAISESPPPLIYAPEAHGLDLPDTYTQKSGLDALAAGTGKHMREFLDLSLVGLNAASSTRKPVDGVALDEGRVVYEVDAALVPTQTSALRVAAWNVPYFGRSMDPASLELLGRRPDVSSLNRLLGTPTTSGMTRGWTARSMSWYQMNYERLFEGGDLPLPAVPSAGYVQPLDYAVGVRRMPVQIVPVTRSVPSHRVPAFMQTLEGLDGFHLPEDLSVFPAVNAGHERSDGRCLGVGITAQENNAATRGKLLAAASELAPLVWERSLLKYQVGPTPRLDAWTLQDERWTGSGADWVSATPYRGFPDEFMVRHVVGEEIKRRFGVEPEVTAYTSPQNRWEHRWAQGRFSDGLRDWWVQIRLPLPVSGPLLLTENQRFGTGVFVSRQEPLRSRATVRSGANARQGDTRGSQVRSGQGEHQ